MDIKKSAAPVAIAAALAAGALAIANKPHEVSIRVESVSFADSRFSTIGVSVGVGAGEKSYVIRCAPGESDLGLVRDARFNEICKLTAGYRASVGSALEPLADSLSR